MATDDRAAGDAANNDRQMYAALTFAVILIVVGMPLWWYTTQVYRVALPYSEMDALRPEIVPRIRSTVHVASLHAARSKNLAKDISGFFSKSVIFNVTVSTAVVPEALLNRATSLQQLGKSLTTPHLEGDVLLVEVPNLGKFTNLKVLLGENSTVFFSTEADSTALLELLDRLIFKESELTTGLLQTWVERTPSARHFAPEPAYDVLITVLHPAPGVANVDFDVVTAIKEYMSVFVDELWDICKLHVKSQWLHLVDLRPNPVPQRAADNISYVLPQASLPHLITPLEKKLGSHVSARPVINLVAWVPPCEWSPLHIHSEAGHKLTRDAFISPRWGGIQICNPLPGSCDVKVDSKQVMEIFVHQLRILLGLPSAASQAQHSTKSHLPIRQWEKDALVRRRTLEFVSSAKHTLKSLSELLGKISNIVINDEVGGSITSALESVRECEAALSAGRLTAAHAAAVAAHTAAETAFTAPSLLALLYFPEDQKYAVYIPLFLPVMIPVLISFKPLNEWFRGKWAHMNK